MTYRYSFHRAAQNLVERVNEFDDETPTVELDLIVVQPRKHRARTQPTLLTVLSKGGES